ncbi:trypco2 family protein [Kitasatospora sp. NPDC052896]|uniref:trypco2 family protein n=1 Tax=Kitasatospora sp. NPDC052896 TaxID=3364061 RepID=UPI0037C8E046
MNEHVPDIELADAIEAVRQQLAAAAERGAGHRIQFEVGPVELEFGVELRRDGKLSGGVRAWVLSADAEVSAGRTRAHRVTVTLTPKDFVTGGSPLVGNPDLGSREGFH